MQIIAGNNGREILKLRADSLKIVLYYVRTPEGFAMVEEQPTTSEYGVLEVEFQPKGIMEGPSVSFWEPESPLRGELLDLARKGSGATLDIHLPKGLLTARDGLGSWSRLINFSMREPEFPDCRTK